MLIVLSIGTFWLFVYINYRRRIKLKFSDKGYLPKISIVIPAYNEEKNIAHTLKSILNSDYPKKKMEIIVINDGSTDKTASIIKKFPVKLISLKKNIGKIAVLNKGIKAAKEKIILTIDSDIEVEPHTIKRMVQYFKDKKVGAVSGIYKSKKIHNFFSSPFKYILEKLQSLEYLGFVLSRKQQEMLDSILVVPGSIAAYRKSVLKKIGGFDDDTLIEDYDTTIKIHKVNYKIRCDKNAIAWVVAPQSLKSLIRERNRWYRGGIQVIKKHRDMFSLTKLGAVTAIWALEVFGMALQLVVFFLVYFKLVYMLMNYSPVQIAQMVFNFTVGFSSDYVQIMIKIGIILALMGLTTTYISIKINNESIRKILLYPFMTVYNSMLFFIWLRALIKELTGSKNVWVKAES
jgi:cellulose synthase/poly-beta-1,6-N-acetylglucosamine synthase-like glycosyltransferase